MPAASRPDFAALALVIGSVDPVSAATAAALKDIVFHRLQTLVVKSATGSAPIAWSCPALKNLIVFQREHGPAVDAVLRLLHSSISSLEVAHIYSSLTTDQLGQVACMPRLEHFGYLGGIIAPDEVVTVKKMTPRPFAKVTDVALAAPARCIFTTLELFGGVKCNKKRFEITFLDFASIDLSPLVDVFCADNGSKTGKGDFGGGSITKLRLSFPILRILDKEDIMPLARLPPTLVDVTLDARHFSSNVALLPIGDGDFVRLFGGQPRPRRLAYFAASPSRHCRRLLHVEVGGTFALGRAGADGAPALPGAALPGLGRQPAGRDATR